MGILFFLISVVLSLVLYPIAFVATIFKAFYHLKFKDGLAKLMQQVTDVAVSIDANGNVVCDDLMNQIFIKGTGYKFGNRKETISSALGKNQISHTLTWLGWIIAKTLDLIQKDHCKISIDDNV